MFELNLFAIRLLSYSAGTLVCLFLLAIQARKHGRKAGDWLLILITAAWTVWELGNGLEHYLMIAGREPGRLMTALAMARIGPGVLIPVLVAVALLAANAARRAAHPRRRFFACMALCMAAMAAVAFSETLLAVSALAPPLCLLRFIYRVQLFDLVLNRRLLFVLTLGAVSAVYLLLVRTLARWLETRLEAFGPLVEVTLVMGAAVTWLPMYEIITRFFSRQGRIYADFSQRVIEEAARILELQKRMEYLVGQAGTTFQLRAAALVFGDDPPRVASFGRTTGAAAAEKLLAAAPWLGGGGRELAHTKRLPAGDPLGRILEETGFNYLFPLRYEDRLTGVLAIDTAPRAFLDESETTLLGLSREISLSLESCRLAESKIVLEKELLHQEYLATLGKVAATIAHEVKNPLSSIKALAQLMREDPDVAERFGRDVNYMIGETDRLNSCVQQLLTFARPLPEPDGEVDLSELAEGAAVFLARESLNQGVEIARRVEPGLKLARAGRQTVHQVVLNLLLNAVQASPRGCRVELEVVRSGDGTIRLEVTDEGPGVPPELREKIFEPFFTTKQQGSGLGLAIVRKNVRQLGGEIEVRTPVAGGRGTAISVAFTGGKTGHP